MTIYLDVSTSYQWRRHPVGVVRVEREFASNLRKQVEDLRFCRLDVAQGAHVLLSDAEVDALLSKEWCRPIEGTGQGVKVPAIGRRAWGAAGRLARGVFPRGEHPSPAAFKSPPGLGQGDVFVSLGADWDHLPVDYVSAMKRQTGCKVVLACYDTIVVDFPEYSISDEFTARLRQHFLGLAENADLVVAISESTRNDLLRFWQRESAAHAGDVVAIPLASASPAKVERDSPLSSRLEALVRQGPYVVYVSTLEARKNHRLLFNLWREFQAEQRHEVPRLVLVGARGWGVDDLLREIDCSEAGREGHIQVWNDVDDDLLRGLYAHCEFGLFPSFYEGWGLAATELLAQGKTCVVSRSSSLQEATQNVCPAYHPCDHLGWRDEILRLSRDPGYLRQREGDIATYFRPRSWEDCSKDLAARLLEMADASTQQKRV